MINIDTICIYITTVPIGDAALSAVSAGASGTAPISKYACRCICGGHRYDSTGISQSLGMGLRIDGWALAEPRNSGGTDTTCDTNTGAITIAGTLMLPRPQRV